MAFVSGAVSYQRFFVTGPLPDEVTEDFVAAVRARSFGRVAAQADESHMGWVGEHLFDTDFDPETLATGQFAQLNLRVDQHKIPPQVLRSYVRQEEATALADSGREFLSQRERRQAKDAAQERAAAEARAGAFRRQQLYPVLFDLAAKTVYVGNLSANVAERVLALAADTFGVTLEPAMPEMLAYRQLQPLGKSRALETLQHFHLIEAPDDGVEAERYSGDLNFLGGELLTWLWFRSAHASRQLRVAAGDEVTVSFERTLRLKCDFGLTGTDVITADAPTALPEALAALRTGKQPDKAGLLLAAPLGELRLVLDGPKFAVSSLVLPEPPADETDPLAARERRFELVTDTAALLDALFELYLQQRVDSQWQHELAELERWAAGDAARRRYPAVPA